VRKEVVRAAYHISQLSVVSDVCCCDSAFILSNISNFQTPLPQATMAAFNYIKKRSLCRPPDRTFSLTQLQTARCDEYFKGDIYHRVSEFLIYNSTTEC